MLPVGASPSSKSGGGSRRFLSLWGALLPIPFERQMGTLKGSAAFESTFNIRSGV